VISVLKQRGEARENDVINVWNARTMFDITVIVSDAVRDIERRDGKYPAIAPCSAAYPPCQCSYAQHRPPFRLRRRCESRIQSTRLNHCWFPISPVTCDHAGALAAQAEFAGCIRGGSVTPHCAVSEPRRLW
jgi:hypothetical protein